MPLPQNGTAWPPKQLAQISPKYVEWSAWYSSDTDRLTDIYTGTTKTRPSQGGLVQRVVRYFWARPDASEPTSRKLHVPMASDICGASADLLFSEPPAITLDEDHADLQDRLDLIAGPTGMKALADGAELIAALGGGFYRVSWDRTLEDHAFISRVDADAALPTFRHDRLVDVTFWQVLAAPDSGVWRLLELHETDTASGEGVVRYGLYRGAADNLGRAVPFEDHPATKWLAQPGVVEPDGVTVRTGSPGLAVVYVPNVTPSRVWREDPLGRSLGRSDLESVEPLLDALDEAYTSLMRDVRLGQTMIVVPKAFLEDRGAGQGATFHNREVFQGVNAAPSSAKDSSLAIEQLQFTIRIAEHEQLVIMLVRQILRSSGYSSSTFGEAGEVAATATEIQARERRSFMNRGRKMRSLIPELERLFAKALKVDAFVFGGAVPDDVAVSVEFPDGVQTDLEALARSLSLLSTALTASIKTRVQMLHPEWDDEQIDDEVDRIREENNLGPVEDPEELGRNGAGIIPPAEAIEPVPEGV